MALYSKQHNTIAYVIEMILSEKTVDEIPYVNYLHMPGFTRMIDKRDTGYSICSYPYGKEAMISCFKNLGLDDHLEICEIGKLEYIDWLKTMTNWSEQGSFIIGPVDMTLFWERIESRYYKNSNYFLYVNGYDREEDSFFIHDPLECPYLLIKSKYLHELFYGRSYQIYRIRSIHGLSDKRSVYRNILTTGITFRNELMPQKRHVTNGLNSIIQSLEVCSLKVSESAAMNFSISEMSISLEYLIEFLVDFPEDGCILEKDTVEKILKLLNQYIEVNGWILYSLKADMQELLIGYFKEILSIEKQLDSLITLSSIDYSYG